MGCGSAGERHAKNLASLGCSIAGVDPRLDRRKRFQSIYNTELVFESLEHALSNNVVYDGGVISSPPAFHIEQTIKLVETRTPVLLEKPASNSLSSTVKLVNFIDQSDYPQNKAVLMGYTWRWWPALCHFRQLLRDSVVGDPFYARIHVSAHLADWHPWERYQDFFMASKALGGGALLDESHWIDQMIWLFGMPNTISGSLCNTGILEIDSDDNVNILATYNNGLSVSLHLDLLGRPHEKNILVLGTNGTLEWNESTNSIFIKNTGYKEETLNFPEQRNDMFLGVATEFFSILEGGTAHTCTLIDGMNVMKIVEAIRQSNNESRVFCFD